MKTNLLLLAATLALIGVLYGCHTASVKMKRQTAEANAAAKRAQVTDDAAVARCEFAFTIGLGYGRGYINRDQVTGILSRLDLGTLPFLITNCP